MYELISSKRINAKHIGCDRYSGPPNDRGVNSRCKNLAVYKVQYRCLSGDIELDTHPLINRICVEFICEECFRKVYKND